MTDKTDICNLALARVQGGSISSIDEGSSGADICAQRYDLARRFSLSAHDWSFARAYISLIEYGATNSTNWLFQYKRPYNAVKILDIVRLDQQYAVGYGHGCHYNNSAFESPLPMEEPVPYEEGSLHENEIITRVIWCDKEEAAVKYTSDVEEENKFSPDFVDVLAWRLAVEIAPSLDGDARRVAGYTQMYRSTLSAAAARDAQMGRKRKSMQSSFIRARR